MESSAGMTEKAINGKLIQQKFRLSSENSYCKGFVCLFAFSFIPSALFASKS